MRTGTFVLITIVASLVACSSSRDMSAAEVQVAGFHAALSAGNMGDIMAQSSDDLRKPAVEAKLKALLGAISRKLGHVTGSTRTSWRINYGTGGEQISLQYSTKFERGTGVEQFLYKGEGGRILLDGYHINSDELVIN